MYKVGRGVKGSPFCYINMLKQGGRTSLSVAKSGRTTPPCG